MGSYCPVCFPSAGTSCRGYVADSVLLWVQQVPAAAIRLLEQILGAPEKGMIPSSVDLSWNVCSARADPAHHTTWCAACTLFLASNHRDSQKVCVSRGRCRQEQSTVGLTTKINSNVYINRQKDKCSAT